MNKELGDRLNSCVANLFTGKIPEDATKTLTLGEYKTRYAAAQAGLTAGEEALELAKREHGFSNEGKLAVALLGQTMGRLAYYFTVLEINGGIRPTLPDKCIKAYNLRVEDARNQVDLIIETEIFKQTGD